MIYYPWFDEQADLLGRYAIYEGHYRHVKTIVQQMREYTQKQISIDDTGNAVPQMLPPEHL